MSDPLGRLERVELHNIWQTEAQDFTPWLAREENLAVLSDTLGIDLELEAQERSVGPFRADILCKDAADDSWVLVENQLERTDHKHLGQLLTYASGLHAVTIVWIAARFTDEHRAALDWLNEITDEKFQFFGLEVELWRIGESLAAPKFNVISKPNDWSRSVSSAKKDVTQEGLSDTKQQQRRYWAAMLDTLAKRESALRIRSPRPQHWQNFSVGRSGFRLASTVNTFAGRVRAELFVYREDAKAFFFLLKAHSETIEAEFGSQLDWDELPGKKGARISISRNGVDPTDESDWPCQHAWLLDQLERLHQTFSKRVKALDPEDWQPSEEEAP